MRLVIRAVAVTALTAGNLSFGGSFFTANAADAAATPPATATSAASSATAAKPAAAAAETPAAPAAAAVSTPAAPKALPPDVEGECRRVGERVISLLYRDDVDQSRKFLDFYRFFGCRESHLAPSFRCLVQKADAEATRYQTVLNAVNGDTSKIKKEDQQKELSTIVTECWSTP